MSELVPLMAFYFFAAMMNNFGSGRKRKSPSSSLGGPEAKINFGGLKALSRGPHSSISRSKKSSLGGLKNKLKTAGHSSRFDIYFVYYYDKY